MRRWKTDPKVAFLVLALLILLGFSISSCTPLVVAGAAAGGGYAGYTLGREGYSIQITKPVKGKKIKDNSTSTGREKVSQ